MDVPSTWRSFRPVSADVEQLGTQGGPGDTQRRLVETPSVVVRSPLSAACCDLDRCARIPDCFNAISSTFSVPLPASRSLCAHICRCEWVWRGITLYTCIFNKVQISWEVQLKRALPLLICKWKSDHLGRRKISLLTSGWAQSKLEEAFRPPKSNYQTNRVWIWM